MHPSPPSITGMTATHFASSVSSARCRGKVRSLLYKLKRLKTIGLIMMILFMCSLLYKYSSFIDGESRCYNHEGLNTFRCEESGDSFDKKLTWEINTAVEKDKLHNIFHLNEDAIFQENTKRNDKLLSNFAEGILINVNASSTIEEVTLKSQDRSKINHTYNLLNKSNLLPKPFYSGKVQPVVAYVKRRASSPVTKGGRALETLGTLKGLSSTKDRSSGDDTVQYPGTSNKGSNLKNTSAVEEPEQSIDVSSRPEAAQEGEGRETSASAPPGGNVTSGPRRVLPYDLHRRVWSPWPNSPSCRRYTVHFTVGAPPRALASYPGSGNTWARYLLEGASGYHTGSVYNDDQLFLSGFRGEMESWHSGTTLLQKTHEYGKNDVASFNGKAVLLLRNPYRAILAYHNFLFGGHKGYAPISNYRRKDWNTFLHLQIKAWLLTALRWLEGGTSVQVLHYEELRSDSRPPVRGVLQGLGLPVEEVRLDCLQQQVSSVFHRRPEYLPPDLKVFSPYIRDKIDRSIRYVDYMLKHRGLPPLPLSLYEFYNNTGSEKIMRVSCPPSSTPPECDMYVDSLNKIRRNMKIPEDDQQFVQDNKQLIKHRDNFSRSDKDMTHGTKTSVQRGTVFGPKTNEGISQVEEDTSLTLMERLNQLPLTDHLVEGLRDFLSPFTANPMKTMVENPDRKDFLYQPIHFDGGHGLESEQLARDFTWPLGEGLTSIN